MTPVITPRVLVGAYLSGQLRPLSPHEWQSFAGAGPMARCLELSANALNPAMFYIVEPDVGTGASGWNISATPDPEAAAPGKTEIFAPASNGDDWDNWEVVGHI